MRTRLGIWSLLIFGSAVALFWAGPALADDCDFAKDNMQLYKENCMGADGCASMSRMEGIVESYCGPTLQPQTVVEAPDTQILKPKPQPPKPRDTTLAAADIALLQAALTALGHDAGSADGLVGPATRRAVIDFQAKHGLAATGDVDQATYDAIMKAAQSMPKDTPAAGHACSVLADLRKLDLEKEWRAAEGRFYAQKELQADLRQLKAQLQSDAYFTAGQWRETTAELLQTATVTGNLITNLAKLNPAVGSTSSFVTVALKAAKRADEILAGAYDRVIIEYWLDEVKAKADPRFQAIKTVKDFAKDMNTLSQIPAGFRQMRDASAEAIARLDAQLATVGGSLASSKAWLETANMVVTIIAEACENERRGAAVPKP